MSIRRIVLPSVAPARFLENKKEIYFIHLTKVDLLNRTFSTRVEKCEFFEGEISQGRVNTRLRISNPL